MIETTAIIVSHNRKAMLDKLLSDIRQQEYPQESLEILVIDDCSDTLYEFEKNVTLIRNTERKGASNSRNIAISRAKGRYVLMLDDDIEIRSKELIRKCIAILRERPGVGVVFSKKIDCRKENGKLLQHEASCSLPTAHSGELKFIKADRGYVEFGHCVFFTYLDILKEAGGYDSNFGLGLGHSFREESDLHFRIRKLGYKLFYEPSLEIVHNITPAGGHGQDIGKFLYWMSHNHLVFLRKSFRDWRFKAFGYIFDILYYSLCFGRFRYLPEAIKGYIRGFKTINSYGHKS